MAFFYADEFRSASKLHRVRDLPRTLGASHGLMSCGAADQLGCDLFPTWTGRAGDGLNFCHRPLSSQRAGTVTPGV